MNRYLVLAAGVLIIFVAVVAIVSYDKAQTSQIDSMCSKTYYSEDNCPADECKLGPSCPFCKDIACRANNYDRYWR